MRVRLCSKHVQVAHVCLSVFSQACQLLTDIVYFVASQENTGGDPFDVQLTQPDRERQKLLREQNVLKEVCTVSHQVLFPEALILSEVVLLDTYASSLQKSWPDA